MPSWSENCPVGTTLKTISWRQWPVQRDGFPLSFAEELPVLADSLGSPCLGQGRNKQQQSREKVTAQDAYKARDPCFFYKLAMLVKRQELDTWGLYSRGFFAKVHPVQCSKTAIWAGILFKPSVRRRKPGGQTALDRGASWGEASAPVTPWALLAVQVASGSKTNPGLKWCPGGLTCTSIHLMA